ncbi:hypothetical protein AM593_09403, partial [Mytilus galloprovincialis]
MKIDKKNLNEIQIEQKSYKDDSPSYNNQDNGSQCREMFPGLERQWRIRMSNRLLIPEEQILRMNWMHERVSPSLHRLARKPKFVALKGPDIYLFDYPPIELHQKECYF